MKVKELITALQEQDPEAEVFLYVWEDFNVLKGIQNNKEDKDFPYCKGYSFEEHLKYEPIPSFVILKDSK